MSDPQQTTGPAAPAPKVEYAYVKSGLTGADRDKVAINEWDPAHPLNAEGKPEIWVAGADSPPVKVAKTPEVVRHLRDGELVEVAQSDAAEHRAAFDASMRERQKAALEANPAFAPLVAGLARHGLTLHEVMTGEPATKAAAPEPTVEPPSPPPPTPMPQSAPEMAPNLEPEPKPTAPAAEKPAKR